MTQLLATGQQLLAFIGVNHRQGSGAGQSVAAVGAAKAARRGSVHDLGTPHHTGDRHASGQALGHGDQIRLDTGMLEAEPGAGATEAGLHFVEDQNDAMLLGQLAQCLEKLRWRGEEATIALHRLDEDSGHALRRDLGGEQFVQGGQRHVAGETAIGVGVRGVKHLGGHAEILLVGLAHAGQGGAEQGATMETAAKSDHRRALGMGAGDFHGVLHRFGAGGEQRRLVRDAAVASYQFAQALHQIQVRPVGHHLEAGMGDFLQLYLHRRQHLRVVVADVHDTDATDEIQVALAVHVPDFSALSTLDDQRVSGKQTARHEALTLLQQIRGFFTFAVHDRSHGERAAWRLRCCSG